jgi:hypothetical protein
MTTNAEPLPSIFHVTHWKSGSQWVSSVLKFAAGERLVHPDAGVGGPLGGRFLPGKIYSPVYATRAQFQAVVPDDAAQRTFVVIRDPRDTLISWYFSLMFSHGSAEPTVQESRDELRGLNKTDGLALMIGKHLQEVARIQRDWITSGARIFRYEELAADEQETFKQIFEFCQLPTTAPRRRWIVFRHSFKVLTWSRPGRENPKSHLRKGVPGDWKNHFSNDLKKLFKAQYGETLALAGYEKDDSW